MRESSSKVRVICLDRDNAIRSQMAEAFLRHFGEGKFEICSGGIDPQPLHPLAVQVMAEINVPMESQRPKSAQDYFGKEAFQSAILVSHPDEGDCPRLFPGALRVERWPNEIPLVSGQTPEQQLERFRRIRDRIKVQAQTWIKAQKDAETGVFSAKRLAVVGH
jgi:arsenate reductase (thioredoxin)